MKRYLKFQGDPIQVISYTLPSLDGLKYNYNIDFGFDVGKDAKSQKNIIALRFKWRYEIFNEDKSLGYFEAIDMIKSEDFSGLSFDEFKRVVSNTYFRFLAEFQKRNPKHSFIWRAGQKEFEDYYRIINPKFPSAN